MVRDEAAVDKACEEISPQFSVKLQKTVTEYLGCEFFKSIDHGKLWIGQPRLIATNEREGSPRRCSLPVVLRQILNRATDEDKLLDGTACMLYMHIVGKPQRPGLTFQVQSGI